MPTLTETNLLLTYNHFFYLFYLPILEEKCKSPPIATTAKPYRIPPTHFVIFSFDSPPCRFVSLFCPNMAIRPAVSSWTVSFRRLLETLYPYITIQVNNFGIFRCTSRLHIYHSLVWIHLLKDPRLSLSPSTSCWPRLWSLGRWLPRLRLY